MQELYCVIYRYLETYCQGRENAIKFSDLGSKISLEAVPWREVAGAIEQLRLQGKPIATCQKGAFIPATAEEKRACLRTIYRRALNTLKTVKALQASFGNQIVQEVSKEFDLTATGQFALKI